ncbi:uncharacterized protein [Miscanthus floridulus]|uniref:uncharacterized protein n=1 Tax=Miscanthus floridulus TaxID=154761 RepID=UPI00345A4687
MPSSQNSLTQVCIIVVQSCHWSNIAAIVVPGAQLDIDLPEILCAWTIFASRFMVRRTAFIVYGISNWYACSANTGYLYYSVDASVDIRASAAATARFRRSTPRNNSSYPIQSTDPAQCRQKRRKLLKQHRRIWGGAASAYSATLQCAQFDDDFVEALKDPSCRNQSF